MKKKVILLALSIFTLNSFANEATLNCNDPLRRYIIQGLEFIQTSDHTTTFEDGGLANIKFIDTLDRKVISLFCGIFPNEEQPHGAEIKKSLKIACSASHFGGEGNIRLRIHKKIDNDQVRLGVLEIEDKANSSKIDSVIPLICH